LNGKWLRGPVQVVRKEGGKIGVGRAGLERGRVMEEQEKRIEEYLETGTGGRDSI